MKQNSYSLTSKIWFYLIIFSIIILLSLWLFQVIFLKYYYRWMKNREIDGIIDIISQEYNSANLLDILDDLSFSNNVCIEIINSDDLLYSSTSQIRGCLIDKDVNDYHYVDKKLEFIKSVNSTFRYETTNPKFHNQTLIYGKKLINNLIVFVTSSLEPIDSTTGILASQLVYVTIGVLLLSFLVAYFISKKISKPIIQINKGATEIASNNYDVKFDTSSNIIEIDELAHTLHETSIELAKTENLRRELLANVSHDLKTPLTMIKAYAEMARDLNNKNVKKRTDNLNIIIDETDRLNLLVNDILELSKVQANVEKLNIEEFDLVDLIQTILNRYEYLQTSQNYQFILEYETNNIVKADRKRIEQVMYNLINNAINYTGDDKKVIIKVKEIDEGIKVEISDTGNGIDENDLALIWDKYYKVDRSFQREVYGTGIGLSIVKNVLINHNFKYGVDTIKGFGTTFWFIIN
ncbi:MAG: HAMP domain-containing histidine kinase [Bacilli bacterium]|nr:HAMP domain-containing histidine kinase [Bacilli bacterium]